MPYKRSDKPNGFSSAGTQKDPGGLGHGPGLPSVPGPAGLHAWAHLPG